MNLPLILLINNKTMGCAPIKLHGPSNTKTDIQGDPVSINYCLHTYKYNSWMYFIWYSLQDKKQKNRNVSLYNVFGETNGING